LGTTSLGEEVLGLECQLEHTNLAGDWVGLHPTASLPFSLLPSLPPHLESHLRREGRGDAQDQQRQVLAGRVQVGQRGPLPCSGHDIVLLGLLVDWAAHAAILQGALPGQIPLLLCREHGKEAMSCPRAILPYCLGQPELGSHCETLDPLQTEAGIRSPGP
jgi:hypothetical protein